MDVGSVVGVVKETGSVVVVGVVTVIVVVVTLDERFDKFIRTVVTNLLTVICLPVESHPGVVQLAPINQPSVFPHLLILNAPFLMVQLAG